MTRFYFKTLLFAILVVPFLGISQNNETLPRWLTDSEKSVIERYQFTSNHRTPPPTGPVRTMAEWEEIEYLLVTWDSSFENILRQIVEVAVQECKVIITTQNETSVSNFLQSNGVDITNVTFMNENWDSIWIRDYAGNTIYSDDVGERALTEWIYNRPRPNDDVMPQSHANLVGITDYNTNSGTNDLVNTGGNFMSDGMGNAFASELILDENSAGNPYGVTVKTEEDIDQIMSDYMGISNFIKMETLPYDEIHHIDMHMKLLDEETLLVSEYPEGVADGPQIEENIEYVVSNFQSPFGTPYKVEWMPAPPSTSGAYPDTGGAYRTYTNAVFVNKSVIVPTYRPEVDDPALAQWQELLPGYNIVGIDVDNPGENLINLLGAIHCITNAIGVAEPLWIVHKEIDEANGGSTIPVEALIKHVSGIANATMFWREAGDTSWNEQTMTAGSDDYWTADFTVPNSNTAIEYYIEAEANSGKTQVRPMVAPEGYWTMNVEMLSVEDWAVQNISGPYPNPTNGEISFNFNSVLGTTNVMIHNTLGQKLFETSLQDANGIFKLDLNEAWNGTLFITFSGDFGNVTKKVIKI